MPQPDMEEYYNKMESVLSIAIKVHLDKEKLIVVRGYSIAIDHINRVYPKVQSETINLPVLFSGNSFDVNVTGIISLFQKKDDGTQGRDINFWVRPAVIKFHSAGEYFEVVDISGLLAIDFKL